MTLVVHIGTHKTGTTAIQRFAAEHRKTLARRGLWYPSYAEIGLRGHYRGHHDFAHAIAGIGKRMSLDDAKRFAELIRNRLRPDETVLISAEPIYRHVLPEDNDYWARREAYVRRLKDIIGLDDVTILVVLRRQDSFARSLYQQKVKSGKYSLSFRQFLVDERYEFEYHRQLSIFKNVFGKVDVLIYEDIQQHGLIDAFFGHLGVAVSDASRNAAENLSLPLELVEYKRLLNATKVGKGRLEAVVEKLEKRAKKGGLRNHVDWVSRPDMEAFYASFDEENERLRRDFMSDRPPPVFPSLATVPIEDNEEYKGMSARRFAELTAEIVL
jgi:hypothetical protein